jgi:putative endopeptidase
MADRWSGTNRRIGSTSLAALAAMLLSTASGPGAFAIELAPPGPDDLAFSVENMDTTAKPGADFYRYASGRWLDRAKRPDHLPTYGTFDIMRTRQEVQMEAALSAAADASAGAPKGSPTQQVGAFYKAMMDVEALDAAGIAPLKPRLDEIAALGSVEGLATLLGGMSNTATPAIFAAFGPYQDRRDNSRYVIYGFAGSFGITYEDVLAEPTGSPRIEGYRTYLASILRIAGYAEAEAKRIADVSIAIEKELHAAKLTPVEAADPVKSYNPKTLADLQAEIPQFDIAAYLTAADLAVPERIIVLEPRYFPALSKLLRERPLQDLKDYIAVRVINAYVPVLSTAFDEPIRGLQEAITGVGVLPSREERVQGLLQTALGHPVGRIYVDAVFTPEEKAEAEAMIDRIRGVFADRIPTRDWLTDATRKAAKAKLDAFTIRVGYPDTWIDYSAVDIGSDTVANLDAISAFNNDRMRAKLDKPPVRDQFADPSGTLPSIVNAGYDPVLNGFEIPAAILQPPMFDATKDAAVNFCRIGAVIGHEMTHGFDSVGRQYDDKGNLRDWWMPEDAAAFTREAQKLIDQANAYEVLPGVSNNGALQVTENMADVGGITLAFEALRRHLADHPEENVEIDGLTPEQRCFIAWTQLWTSKSTDGYLRALIAADPHAPTSYRAVAPLQHVQGFYDAFGIGPGDPLWLPPEKRVDAW